MSNPTTARFLLSRADLDFQLYDWLDVESLVKRERYAEHSRETFDDVLDLCATVAAERFAPHNKLNDSHEPELVDGRIRLNPEVQVAVDAVGEAGLVGSGMDAEVGGLQLPQVLQTYTPPPTLGCRALLGLKASVSAFSQIAEARGSRRRSCSVPGTRARSSSKPASSISFLARCIPSRRSSSDAPPTSGTTPCLTNT
ncbi:acyl-CoA dehydrogenase family protein [Pseudonocardia sp. KRD291]|uniref:acyl-CoA dehydrogenase family protein n=1 Tax=Pseudonocardia sp. KRD291 TaxID=2792007 RepID=UPI001C49FA33|nr:acyl-CoA dehydrogenase family protein [Pseudonocardia sp. KRD291]MBW0102058.1 acyl-CoA dehydrogenase [Pseudonocardia sp. KRD291]